MEVEMDWKKFDGSFYLQLAITSMRECMEKDNTAKDRMRKLIDEKASNSKNSLEMALWLTYGEFLDPEVTRASGVSIEGDNV
jgi:hypothetical protein|tara:strand:+ start:84 stop:329 length:246 start_codon:yes stop_codon:yes gene_type:complete